MKLTVPERLQFGIILLVGFVLRAFQLGSGSLTNDELSALNRLNYPDLSSMLRSGVMELDFHPAGVETFLWFWTEAFGTGEWTLRLPFMVCGMLAIWFTFLVGRKWGGTTVGLTASAFVACLAFPVLYSRLARPYAPGMLFTLITLWFWSRIILGSNKESNRIDLLGFAFFGALCAYTHYLSALSVLLIGITGLFLVPRSHLLRYLASGALMALLFLPHWSITRMHLGQGGIGGSDGWLAPPGKGWLWEHFTYAFNSAWIPIGIVLLGAIWALRKFHAPRSLHHWGAIWYLLLLMIGYFYSHYVNPIFQDSGMIFAFPALLIALSWWLVPRSSAAIKLAIPTTTLLLCTITTLTLADPFGKKQFGEFKAIAQAMDEWSKVPGKDSITTVFDFNNMNYIDHYLARSVDKNALVVRGHEQYAPLMHQLLTTDRPYFEFTWSTTEVPFEVYPLIRHFFPFTFADRKYVNSRATLFHRTRGERLTPSMSRQFDPASEAWSNIINRTTSPQTDLVLEKEFIAELRVSGKELLELGIAQPFINLEMALGPVQENAEVLLVLEWTNSGESFRWRGSELAHFIALPDRSRYLVVADHVSWEIDPNMQLKAYCWNKGKSQLRIDQLRFTVQSDR